MGQKKKKMTYLLPLIIIIIIFLIFSKKISHRGRWTPTMDAKSSTVRVWDFSNNARLIIQVDYFFDKKVKRA